MKRLTIVWTLVMAVAVAVSACAGSVGEVPSNVGHEAGNGGHGVVCRKDGRVRSVELLDYYAVRMLMPDLAPKMGRGTTELEKALAALERLEKVDAPRAGRYRRAVESFFEDSRFIDEAILGATTDYGYLPPLEVGCKVEQIVVQRKTPFPEMKRYLIQQSLWNRLSIEHRAGLILHEVVYGHALELGHKNSEATRYLTALISSAKLETSTEDAFAALMTAIGFSGGGSSMVKPMWVADVLPLSPAQVGQPYEVRLRPYVRYAGDQPLTFSSPSLPEGLELDPNGRLWTRNYVMPPSIHELGAPDVSATARIPVVVTTADGYAAKAIAQIRVEMPPPPPTPVWSSNPLVLPDAKERVAYSVDVAGYVRCHGPMTLSGSDLPKWLRLAPNGVLSGTPNRADVGAFTMELTANCPGGAATVTAKGNVLVTPQPLMWAMDPLHYKATAGMPFSQSLAEMVHDPEGGPLAFRMISGPTWMTIGANGVVKGTPALADVGMARAAVQVSNGTLSAQAALLISVSRPNLAPTWLQGPIHLRARANQAFSTSIAAFVQNDGGLRLSFAKVSGPAWLMVTETGNIVGTPRREDIGENGFIIEFRTNDVSVPVTESAKLTITVGG